MNSFPDLEAIGARWVSCWVMTDRLYSGLPRPEQLDRALVVFLAQEMEEDNGDHERPVVIGATLAAVTRTGTHSKEAIQASFNRIMAPPKKKFFERANTRTKRLVLLAFPFFAVTTLYRGVQDLDHYRWEPSLSFFLFALASMLCLMIAFTRLGDWIEGGA